MINILYFNIWIISGFIAFLHIIFIDKFQHEDLGFGENNPYNVPFVLFVSLLFGVVIFLWTLWYRLESLRIALEYHVINLWSKLYSKK